MNLDDAQRKKVSAWIAEGLKLSEIQNRLAAESGLRLTYMEIRLLVDDLKLVPKDLEPPKTALPGGMPLQTEAPPAPTPPRQPPEPSNPPGAVSVSVDQLARAGAMVSGRVTFSDGNTADWYLDPTGRLGLASKQKGYRPPPADMQQFQMALETELAKMGLG